MIEWRCNRYFAFLQHKKLSATLTLTLTHIGFYYNDKQNKIVTGYLVVGRKGSMWYAYTNQPPLRSVYCTNISIVVVDTLTNQQCLLSSVAHQRDRDLYLKKKPSIYARTVKFVTVERFCDICKSFC